MSISSTDTPLKLLQIHFPLNFAHHCHVGLRYYQIRSSLKTKLIVNVSILVSVDHLHKKCRVDIVVDGSDVLVKIHQIFVLGEQLASSNIKYSQNEQVRAVK